MQTSPGMSQLELEQTILIAIMNRGVAGDKPLPLNLRSTAFSLSAHQDIYKTIELMIREGVAITVSSVASRCERRAAAEIAVMVATVPVREQLKENQLEE